VTRRRVLLALAAVVLVLGLGLTAGVFDSARFDRGDEPRTSPPVEEPAEGGSGDLLLILGYWLVVAFALFGAAMAVRSGEGTPVRIALLGTGILVAGVLVYALSTISGTVSVPPDPVSLADVISAVTGGESAPAGGGPEDPGGAGDEPTGGPGVGLVIVVILVLGGIVLAAMLAQRFLESADSEAAASDEGNRPTPAWTPSDSARNRETDADANAIYAAWRELTTTLTVPDPETTTPAQFAEAAIDAGFDPGEVTDLTHLFRAVRYGNADPSPARVDRAREAIERLEGTTLAVESETTDSATTEAERTRNTDSGGQP
jgi:hypothetical protein